jgi:signal transduction histidine kinase
VNLMDGQLSVQSTSGVGSCFRFVVPVGLPAAA